MNQDECLSGWSQDAIILLSNLEAHLESSPPRIASSSSPAQKATAAYTDHLQNSSPGRQIRNKPPGKEIGKRFGATNSFRTSKQRQLTNAQALASLQQIPSYVFDSEGRYRSSGEDPEEPEDSDFARAESTEIAEILATISDVVSPKNDGFFLTRGPSFPSDRRAAANRFPRARSNVNGPDSLPLDLLLGDAHILKSSQKLAGSPSSSARSQQDTPLASKSPVSQRLGPGPIQVRPATAVKHSPLALEHSPRRPVTAGTGPSKQAFRLPIASAMPYEPSSPRPLLLLPATPRSSQDSHRAFMPFRKPRRTPGEDALADEPLPLGAEGIKSPRATIEDNRDPPAILLGAPSAVQGCRVTPRDRHAPAPTPKVKSMRQRSRKEAQQVAAEETSVDGIDVVGGNVADVSEEPAADVVEEAEAAAKKLSYFPKTKAMDAGAKASDTQVHFTEEALLKPTEEDPAHRQSPTAEAKSIRSLHVHVRLPARPPTLSQHGPDNAKAAPESPAKPPPEPPVAVPGFSVCGSRVASCNTSPWLTPGASSRRVSLMPGGAGRDGVQDSPVMAIDIAHAADPPALRERAPTVAGIMPIEQREVALRLEDGAGMLVSPMLPPPLPRDSPDPKLVIVYKKNAAFSRELLKVGGRPPPSMKEGGLYSGRPVNMHISSPRSHGRIAGWTYGRGITAGRGVLGAFRQHERERQKNPGTAPQSPLASTSLLHFESPITASGNATPTPMKGGPVAFRPSAGQRLVFRTEQSDVPRGVRGEALPGSPRIK